jgi:competence protein ComEC
MYLVVVISWTQYPWTYEVSMINVGQGDAFFIQAPLNKINVLIDTGPQRSYRQIDTFLKAQGIQKIDVLIITHDDHDHSGALELLNLDYQISSIIRNPSHIDNPWLQMHALTVDEAYSINDASLVYWTQIHRLRFLFLGDISSHQERLLAHKLPQLRSDVIKIAHHGSKTSSSDILFHWTHAKIALIGVGHNRYGHPHPDVMERLNQHHIKTYQSLVHGDVKIFVLPWINILMTSRYEFLVL